MRTITFTLERETKGAVRYAELDASGRVIDTRTNMDAAVVGTLYIRKAALDGQIPVRIKVTIE